MLGQILVLVLLLLLAKPGTTGLLLLFGLLHRYARNTPEADKEKTPLKTTFGSRLTGMSILH